MKIENTELNEIPPPIEKILEFDIEDLHFRMMVTKLTDSLVSDSHGNLNQSYQIICLVKHKPMGTALGLESGIFEANEILNMWEMTRERFVKAAIANKLLLAKPPFAIKMRV